MGAANVVPGVSGGTIAFITGIYQRLLDSLKAFDVRALRMLMKMDIGGFAKHVDLGFLISLGLGVLASIVTLAKILKDAYASSPVLVDAFFFGLILASIFSVGKMVKKWRPFEIVALLLGCGIAVWLAFLEPAAENKNLGYLMVCGAAGMCSMIIPGISGSFILLLMGNYKLIILNAVNDLRALKFAESLPILIPVGIGAVLGLVVLSRVLSWLFKKYHDTAVALITGFVAGSLVIIWPWKSIAESVVIDGKVKVIAWHRELPDLMLANTWVAVAWLVGGIALIAVTEKLASKG
ncbi:DUF368 domain-containing protein [Verrucomicrobiaceae bacterium 5K15]|uniref:DUF368 domain-containing protein n=2 Tax=Oceaniferula flava TaxID=2800421 RepID=A0AAE2V9H9_9BACT|nr:DUF368 domain-containing protein [Oceaniferula flavus]MBM1136439.1 DUF368 domain-containing protein [Oceaniferula flavus]